MRSEGYRNISKNRFRNDEQMQIIRTFRGKIGLHFAGLNLKQSSFYLPTFL